MNKLIYYPGLNEMNPKFMKASLLYIDEMQIIEPYFINEKRCSDFNVILEHTNLFHGNTPELMDKEMAADVTIHKLENYTRTPELYYRTYFRNYRKLIDRGEDIDWKYQQEKSCTLYSDLYSKKLEDYCINNGFAIAGEQGLEMNEAAVQLYMNDLANCIAFRKEMEPITDNKLYVAQALTRRNGGFQLENKEIPLEIAFQVPKYIEKVPIKVLVELRNSVKYGEAQKGYLRELQQVIKRVDKDYMKMDMYGLIQCKNEMKSLIGEWIGLCSGVLNIAVHAFVHPEITQDKLLKNLFGLTESADQAKENGNIIKDNIQYINDCIGKEFAEKYWLKSGGLGYKAGWTL